jgi:metal-responsive CopG/Arc/MetJ family transcriptional regulator
MACTVYTTLKVSQMRTIQMTLDEDLVQAVDRVVKQLRTNRSAFTRKALRAALARYDIEQSENKHRRGYERYPVNVEEFSVWEGDPVCP